MIPFDERNYHDMVEIACGGSAEIHSAIRKEDFKLVAIKQVSKSDFGPSMLTRIYGTGDETADHKGREIPIEYVILSRLDHPQIPKVYSLEEDDDYFYIVMDLFESESLDWIIHEREFTQAEVAYILGQLLDILEYLYQNKVVHRDIKSENILINENLRVTLVDFGFAAYIPETESVGGKTQLSLFTDYPGSPCYAAPELFKEQPYSGMKTQIWSLGVILYALLLGKYPFGSGSELKKNVLEKNPFQNLEKRLPRDSYDLLRSMLSKKGSKRPSIRQIRQSNFFRRFSKKFPTSA